MKIAYIYPEKLPAKNARSISVINTFNNLNKICDIKLYIERSNLDKLKLFYNLDTADNIINIDKKCIIRTNKIFNYNLTKRLKKDNINIVYARHLKAANHLIQKGFKVVFECHEIFHQTAIKQENKQLTELENFVYTHAIGLTFINQSLRNEFNTVFKLNNPQCVVHNGTDFNTNFYHKDFSNIEEIYYIGNFIKWKGVEDLIKAVSEIKYLKLNIIGDGKEKPNLVNLVNTLNITNRVNFLGFMNKQEVFDILTTKSQITIISNQKTKYSNFSTPIKLYEYMATNNIIITANTNPMKEIIIDNTNGFLFESGNVKSLVSVIKKVITLDSKTLDSFALKAFEKSKEFSWKNRAKNILNFVTSI